MSGGLGPSRTLAPLGRKGPIPGSAKDKAAGKFHEVKGKLKQRAGKLLMDPELEADGAVEAVVGQAQQALGKLKGVLGK